MASLSELQTALESLEALRANGIRRVQIGQTITEFRADGELRDAINSVKARIAEAQSPRVSLIRVSSSKGL